MVIIKDLKPITKGDGTTFYALIVEGSVEPVRSEKTGRIYFTARRATVPTTFDKQTCEKVIGTEFNGDVRRVECDPYDYTIETTGETIELSHRWEFMDESLEVLENHMVKSRQKVK